MQLEKADIDFLEENRYHYNLLVNAGMVRHLDGATRQRMQDIISKYFIRGYTADLWCPTCVMDMLKKCYELYDNWNAKKN